MHKNFEVVIIDFTDCTLPAESGEAIRAEMLAAFGLDIPGEDRPERPARTFRYLDIWLDEEREMTIEGRPSVEEAAEMISQALWIGSDGERSETGEGILDSII